VNALRTALPILWLAASAAAAGAEIPDDVHLGVASCATSVCHGKLSPQEDEPVWLNEYRIWTADDRHSKAYRTLLSDESKRIARNLGLPSAHTADVCLDCHADNVPAEKRGPKFQLSDGVGCEACHGGSERWIESHAEEGATHADNLAAGMYPSEQPGERARLCLDCHLGAVDQFATHDILGAGHPRLAFELEAFTANQPAHYEVDADYRARKGEIPGFNLWLTGQLDGARRYLELLRSGRLAGTSMYPELAFYDCHGCHHPMDDLRWDAERKEDGVGPGALRLQDHNLLVLEAVTGVLEPDARGEFSRLRGSLLRAGTESVTATRAAASELLEWIGDRAAWRSRAVGDDRIRSVRRALLAQAASGRMGDYAAAEQAFLALESLSYTLGDVDARQDALDRLYGVVESDRSYDPSAFARTARAVQDGF
jgi:hypothetical protein